ncbi:MAG: hypothetical protein P1U57_00315 [Oleibacter sp.]|nr:hypothetical protein [Thalassolituus sp.]
MLAALGTQSEVDVSISWSEIFLQEPEIDYGQLLEQWASLVSGKIQPIGLSAFGGIYFLQPDGFVKVLDVLEGQCMRLPSLSKPLVNA